MRERKKMRAGKRERELEREKVRVGERESFQRLYRAHKNEATT